MPIGVRNKENVLVPTPEDEADYQASVRERDMVGWQATPTPVGQPTPEEVEAHQEAVDKIVDATVYGATPARTTRPTNPFNDEQKVGHLCALLAQGNPIKTSLAALGLAPMTFYRWMEEGREPGAPQEMVEFVAKIDQAIALCTVQDVAIIDKHAKKDPKWAAWRLERRDRATWGAQAPEHQGHGVDHLVIEINVPTGLQASQQAALPAVTLDVEDADVVED